MNNRIAFALLLALAACGDDGDHAVAYESDSPSGPAVAKSVKPESLTKLEAALQQLTGLWRSDDDTAAVIEFRNGYLHNYYQRQHADSAAFSLRQPQSADTSITTEMDDFILTSGDLTWIITDMTDNHLTMIYTGRGNLLTYSKVGL